MVHFKFGVNEFIREVCDQAAITDSIEANLALTDPNYQLFLVKEEEGFGGLELGNCDVFFRDHVV